MIKSLNTLVPRNIDGRTEKLKQHNLKLLQQEVIEGQCLKIDDTFNFSIDEVKTRIINGSIHIKVTTGHLPEWLKNVTVNGHFSCATTKLFSLQNCPEKINGNFLCQYNKLTTLIGCPKHVKGYFDCSNNPLTSLKGMPEYVGMYFHCWNCSKQFASRNIPENTIIKNEIYFK